MEDFLPMLRRKYCMKRTDQIFIGLTLGLAALVWAAHGRIERARHPKAPNFKVLTDQGKTISPSQFGGKLLVLNFWASWCVPCIEETASLKAFETAFRSKGVVVLGISIDEDERTYAQFLKRVQVHYDTWRDPQAEGGIAARYGTFQIPETYIIDASGYVAEKIPAPVNFMDPDFLAIVQKLL